MFPHCNYAVRYPEEGASGTPPPTGCARCRFQRSREVQFITPVTFCAASPVSLLPVRGGVLDAPRLRDCRGAVDADVWRGRFYSRFPRRARLRLLPNASNPAGTARAPLVRASEVVHHPRPGGRGSPPLRWGGWVDWQRYYVAPTLHQPLSHGAKRRDSSPFRGAEGWVRARRLAGQPTPGGRGGPPLRRAKGPVRGPVLFSK